MEQNGTAQKTPAFSHIVIGEEDEDQVIVAGCVPDQPPAEEPADQGQPAPAAPAAPTEVDSQPEPAPAAPAASQPAAASQTPAPQKKDAYQETTLDDLKGQPMSGLQKGILVFLVLCILAFVIFQVFVRPTL
ncbi:MAG: hypothetical protein Q4E12_01300 [Coriobacteriia bacterium]|nr:hypothetical protein [Coriobacteriia bacterium]